MIETPVPCWMDRGPTVETVDAMTRGLRNPRPRFSTTVWTHSKIGGSGEDLSFNLSFDRPYRCVAHPPTTSFCSSFFVVHGVWKLVRQDEQQSGRTRWRRRRRSRQLRCRPDGRLSRPGGPSTPQAISVPIAFKVEVKEPIEGGQKIPQSKAASAVQFQFFICIIMCI